MDREVPVEKFVDRVVVKPGPLEIDVLVRAPPPSIFPPTTSCHIPILCCLPIFSLHPSLPFVQALANRTMPRSRSHVLKGRQLQGQASRPPFCLLLELEITWGTTVLTAWNSARQVLQEIPMEVEKVRPAGHAFPQYAAACGPFILNRVYPYT